MNEVAIELLNSELAELILKNSTSFISDRITKVKAKKQDQNTINELEDIINDLITDKNNLIRIAKSYEEELIYKKITENDIKYITENLMPIINEFLPSEQQKNIENFQKILSVEMLTIMQLIGFNYKQAIGEPLTHLLKKSIEDKVSINQKDNLKYIESMAKISMDKEAFDRFMKLTNKN